MTASFLCRSANRGDRFALQLWQPMALFQPLKPSSTESGNLRLRMPSRASAFNSNWRNMALSSVSATERRAASSANSREAFRGDERVDGPSSVTRHLDDASTVETANAPGDAYNEAAFRYFLQVEEKRFLRSNRRFLLLLIDVQGESGAAEDLDPALSKQLFTAVWPCVRETDFVGWYRQGRVIGVACTHVDDAQGTMVAGVVTGRFQNAMHEALPQRADRRVQVRSYFLPSNGGDRS